MGRPKSRGTDGPGVVRAQRPAPSCAPHVFCKNATLASVGWRRRFPRWSDCTAHRREHKVSADCATAGTCEPGAPCGRGAEAKRLGGAALGGGVACDVLPQPELVGAHRRSRGRRVHGARQGGEKKIAALGACKVGLDPVWWTPPLRKMGVER